MIRDPALLAIRTGREASMTDSVRSGLDVLSKDAVVIVLFPGTRVHGIVSHQFELTETVVAIIRPGSTVNEKVLTCRGVDELLWPFVARQSNVKRPAIWRLFPRVRGRADDLAIGEIGLDGPRI